MRIAIWRSTEDQTRALADALLRRGIFIPASAYPGGPAPVYLRISVTAMHKPEQIQRLADALRTLAAADHVVCEPRIA